MFEFLRQNGVLKDGDQPETSLYNKQKNQSSSTSKCAEYIGDACHRFLIGYYLYGQLLFAENTTEIPVYKTGSRQIYQCWAYYHCSQCNYWNKLKSNCERHQARVHQIYDKIPSLRCPGCSKSFSVHETLLKHVKNTHKNINVENDGK